MSFEAERGCGYREIHGLYLMGNPFAFACDRLPLEILPCNNCGEMPRFTRGIQKINFLNLYGEHKNCKDPKNCYVCYPAPNTTNFMMWVGEDYTKKSLMKEAWKLGVSKRIPFIPEDLVMGESYVFLAKKGSGKKKVGFTPSRDVKCDEVFYVFVPKRLDYLITKDEATKEYISELESKGITPVIVPKKYEHMHKKSKKKEFIKEEEIKFKKLDDYINKVK